VLKRLAEKLKQLGSTPPFDASQFNDPLALETGWSPLKQGGTNFKTHSLRPVHAQRMEFRISIGMELFAGVFMLFGALPLIGFVPALLNRNENTGTAFLIILPVIGLIFGSVGFFLYRGASVPRVFDLSQGYYCRDRRKPEHSFDTSQITDHVRLRDVHALQLISEHCHGGKSSYSSHELNLVLSDGSRINVVDHGGGKAMVRDAQTLANFLGKPLWNGL